MITNTLKSAERTVRRFDEALGNTVGKEREAARNKLVLDAIERETGSRPMVIECPHCSSILNPQFIASSLGKISAAKRAPSLNGQKLKACPLGCGGEYGVRAMRRHLPNCPRKRKMSVKT